MHILFQIKLSVDPLNLLCSIIPMTDERNWDDLPDELVSKVAELLLRSDVTDYIHLRDIVRYWIWITQLASSHT